MAKILYASGCLLCIAGMDTARVGILFYFRRAAVSEVGLMYLLGHLAFKQYLAQLLHRQHLERENNKKDICKPFFHPLQINNKKSRMLFFKIINNMLNSVNIHYSQPHSSY